MTIDKRANLIGTRELLADPSRHCQGNYARTKSGHAIGPTEANARSWCIFGALTKVTAETTNSLEFTNVGDDEPVFGPLLEPIARELSGDSSGFLPDINDGETEIPGLTPHQAVLKILDVAIERVSA